MPIGWIDYASSLLPVHINISQPNDKAKSPYQNPLSDDLGELLDRNKEWAKDVCWSRPKLFTELSKTQTPRILWIGCSDSRVPETEICKASPGDIFVHRNIANVVYENDPSLNSVLQYSVEALKVEHIVVCGHYCCGGVKAAMDPPALKQVCDWINPIAELYQKHKEELDKMNDPEAAWKALVHYNVQNSIEIIKRHPSVKNALASENPIKIHHWVYDISTGHICKPN